MINLIAFTVIAFLYFSYVEFVAMSVPIEYALEVNAFLVPFLFGILGASVLQQSFAWQFLMLTLLPVSTLIVLGGDSGKRGLEYVLTYAELFSLWLGIVSLHATRWILVRWGEQ